MIVFPKPNVEKFLRTYGIQNFSISPDEKQLVFSTNLNGKYNLWAMDLPDSFPYPLTFIDQSCQALQYDKHGRFIVAGFDFDGNENTQLYAIPLQGGTMKEIVYQENTRNFSPLLSEDGKRLYYTSSKDNSSYLNSYCLEMESGEEKLVLEGKEAATYVYALSSDEAALLYYKHFSNTHSLLYARRENEDILLTPPTKEQHTAGGGVFVSDSLVYLLTDYDADFTYLASFDLETKIFAKVKELHNESFSSLHYNKEHQLLYVIGEKGVEDFLYEYDLNNDVWRQLVIPCSVIDQLVAHKSGALYICGRSATAPQNIYKRVGYEWVSLTNFKVPGIDCDELVEPEVVKYKSFDGLQIEALLFKAKTENDIGKMVFWPHGGPQASERKEFKSYFQFLLSEGYSIFAPNFRGSTGYGLKFMKMVEGNWGHGPRLDNVAGLDWLVENGYAKKGEIVLMGGSYGGYMALLLHGRHAEYFSAVVDICGPSDLFSFINSVPDFWKPVMDQWVGHPERDKEKLIEYSPITYLDGMTKPMLVIQGANDPRVVKEESEKIVQSLRQKGRNVEYMLMEDEGHGFSKKENEIAAFRKIQSFLKNVTSESVEV
ncbi:MAG: S9 family peptidase [Bacillus sp. (in: firmicutes)]